MPLLCDCPEPHGLWATLRIPQLWETGIKSNVSSFLLIYLFPSYSSIYFHPQKVLFTIYQIIKKQWDLMIFKLVLDFASQNNKQSK